jgi:hypothetical protein
MQSWTFEQPARGSWATNTVRGGTLIPPLLPHERPRLPTDLSEWVSPGLITTWIEQEIRKMDWDNPLWMKCLQRCPECRHRAMVCLLSFAYATGLFSSQEIAEAAWSEAMLRAICNGQPPSAREVRTFRRQNRSAIECVLAGVLRQAIIRQFALHANPLLSEIEPVLRDHAAERIEIARQMDMDDD